MYAKYCIEAKNYCSKTKYSETSFLIQKQTIGNRPKGWSKGEREGERIRKRENWYKKRGDEAVNFMPATPGSKLQKRYQKEIRDQGFKIKVVEKTGVTLKRMLQRSDPFRSQDCKRERCMFCKNDGKGSCIVHGVTYEIKCQGCGAKYVGETARNAYTRGIEHTDGLARKDDKSALWKHCVAKHGLEQQVFQILVTGQYSYDAMLRQIAESVRISKIPAKSLINSKKEWNYFQLPRAVIEDKDT